MRNIKTGLSVFVCILISFIFNRDTYVVSSITAVFTLREDMYNTLRFGRHRVVGNVLGALFSVVAIFIFKTFIKTPRPRAVGTDPQRDGRRPRRRPLLDVRQGLLRRPHQQAHPGGEERRRLP